jgi:VWFA-related protein
MSRTAFLPAAVILLILIPASRPEDFAAGASARAPRQQPGGGVEIKVNVDAVLLNVSVLDRLTNRSIPGLRKDDFLVYEDNVAQDIQEVLPADSPFNLLLLLDVSGSTAPYIKLMREAGAGFVSQIGADDRIAVAAFNNRVRLLQDFTGEQKEAARAIRRAHSGGGTAFYDALLTCIDTYMGILPGRKAIVVFTDGVDNRLYGDRRDGSAASFAELRRRVEETDMLIYTIFLDGGYHSSPVNGPAWRFPRWGGLSFPLPFPMPGTFPGSRGEERAAYETAREQLGEIAEQTGGRMYSPRRADDLSAAYAQVAQDLRTQYLLSYSSSNHSHDNRWRSIRVEVNGRPNAVARTRKGYYAGGRNPQAGN